MLVASAVNRNRASRNAHGTWHRLMQRAWLH